MAIDGYSDFTYIGYSLWYEKPTLYFAEGKYIQEHYEPDIVGWHPNPTNDCIRINITAEAAELYYHIRDESQKVTEFAREVVNGTYNAAVGGALCECHVKNGMVYAVHILQGRLIRFTEPSFNRAFDKSYAGKILAAGVFAPNKKSRTMSILTWNTQGINPLGFTLNQMQQNFPLATQSLIPNYICYQEAGNACYGTALGSAITCTWNPAPSLGVYYQITNANINGTLYNGYHVPWRASATGNQRCSMAILWRAILGGHVSFPIGALASGYSKRRPVIWVTPTSGTPRVGCIHAPAGGNMSYLTAALNAIAIGAPESGWYLVGDINIEPENLGALPLGVAVQHTGGWTHMGEDVDTNLDYLFRHTAPAFANVQRAGSIVHSNHLQCRFA
ncbi:MAG: hypothetical protein JW783_14290 [Bacteroidales bacterium]|nr:hypothetical protein [Bacteroidales bacterium]MBN2749723.1 hypothetical protein [Bacteroidales bacterium]